MLPEKRREFPDCLVIELFRVMHISDTHLGSRIYMSDDRENDFYDAFREAIEIAVHENVDFIVHSGDLFDTWSPSNFALARFRDSALSIREAGIPMYTIMGDHDRPKRSDYPAAEIFNFLGVRLLGKDGVESVVHSKDGDDILVAGISNMKGFRRNMLPDEYRKADEMAASFTNSILMSHQGITGFLYDEACEASPSDLPVNFSYLAFGHVHDWALKDYGGRIFSYAGSTELKSIREIPAFIRNGKSINMITIDNGTAKVERRRLSTVRFQFALETDAVNYKKDIDDAISKYSGRFGNKKPVCTLKIVGNADRDKIRTDLASYGDIIFRPPEFIPQTVEVESRPGMENLVDYIEAYFKDSPELAQLAREYYIHARSDRDLALKTLLDRMGVREG